MAIRRFTLSASSMATGSDPWVMSLPTVVGIGTASGSPLHVRG